MVRKRGVNTLSPRFRLSMDRLLPVLPLVNPFAGGPLWSSCAGGYLYGRRDDPGLAYPLRASNAPLGKPLLDSSLGNAERLRGLLTGYECLCHNASKVTNLA